MTTLPQPGQLFLTKEPGVIVFADSCTAGTIQKIVLGKNYPMLFLGYSRKEMSHGRNGSVLTNLYFHFLVEQTVVYRVWFSTNLDGIPVWFEHCFTKVEELK